MTNTYIQQIDDVDTRIRYSGRWEIAGSSDEHNMTTHGTEMVGAQAEFIFNGTSIAVYGTIEAKSDSIFSAVSTYSIDGSSPTTASGLPSNKILYKQLFYRSPNLTDGQHTLVVTSTIGGGSMFWLDYFEIVISGPELVYSSIGSIFSSPVLPPTPTVPVESSETVAPTPSAGEFSRGSVGSGAIAGIAVGSFFCLLLMLFLAWLWRQKTRSFHLTNKISPKTPSLPFWEKSKRASMEVTPFNLTSPPTPPATQGSHSQRTDAPFTITTTTSPTGNQGSGYSIGTTLIDKRTPGANQCRVTNSQTTDRSSMSQTLVNSSSATGHDSAIVSASAPSKSLSSRVPQPSQYTRTHPRGSDRPPAYA